MSNHDWTGPLRHNPDDGDHHPDWDALLEDLVDSGLTPDEIRQRIKPVGAVLAYYLDGPGGRSHACVIHGDPDRAELWARRRIQSGMQSASRMSAIHVVTSRPNLYDSLEIIHPEDKS